MRLLNHLLEKYPFLQIFVHIFSQIVFLFLISYFYIFVLFLRIFWLLLLLLLFIFFCLLFRLFNFLSQSLLLGFSFSLHRFKCLMVNFLCFILRFLWLFLLFRFLFLFWYVFLWVLRFLNSLSFSPLFSLATVSRLFHFIKIIN